MDSYTLVDGHNRHEICTKHGINFKIEIKEFSGREEILTWIEENQMGRRNMTPDQFKLCLGRAYNRRKQKLGGQLPKGVGQNDPPLSTAEKLAEEHGVSEKTVKRAGQIAAAIDKETTDPELIDLLYRAEISTAEAASVAVMDEDEQKEIVQEIKSGKEPSEVIKRHVHVVQNSGENEWYMPIINSRFNL